MSSNQSMRSADRTALLDAVLMASRENSAVAVFFHTAIAERMGLGPTDEKTLDLLSRRGSLTAGEIALATGLTTASVTSLIDRLERKGFVRRVRDSVDRRRVNVEINLDRMAGLAQFFEPLRETFADTLDVYTDDQLTLIIDFLTRITQNSRDMIAAWSQSDASDQRQE